MNTLPPIAPSQPFDLSYIEALWGSPPDDIYMSILAIFAEEAKALCVTAQISLITGHREELKRAAHTLAGAAANIGALDLARKAGAVEAVALSMQTDALKPLLEGIETAWRSVQREIAAGGPKTNG